MQAVPGAGLRVPIWILGSSLFGAQVAAGLGLPFSFASHFAPALLHDAIAIYRDRFTPSAQLETPYVMLGVNVVAADTDAEARFLASSGRQSFASLRSGRPIQLPPPSQEWERDPSDAGDPTNQTRVSFVGAPATVREQMHAFVDKTRADELIVVSHIYDHGRACAELAMQARRKPRRHRGTEAAIRSLAGHSISPRQNEPRGEVADSFFAVIGSATARSAASNRGSAPCLCVSVAESLT